MHVRCPHCDDQVSVTIDSSLADITCPSCDSRFNLIDDHDQPAKTSKKTIAHFELRRQIGRGTFGSVWLAHDTKLDRPVAVKVPRKAQLDRQELEKFFREARAAAQIRHPNIVPVFEMGRDGDTVYLVTEYVEGIPLTDLIIDGKVEVRKSALICAAIADALHHAHQVGVIHRDLKPSNIMIDSKGAPHIMDFGLAKRVAGEVTMTLDGQVIGTPAYMSPEQARGDGHHADGRSDIYSLGVMLFELLCDRRPFKGNVRQVMHKLAHEDPPRLRSIDRSIPRDLETICLKCLEREPKHRYATAADVAHDLNCWLRNEPVRARRAGFTRHFVQWCQRQPLLAMESLALAIMTPTVIYMALNKPVVIVPVYPPAQDAEKRQVTNEDSDVQPQSQGQTQPGGIRVTVFDGFGTVAQNVRVAVSGLTSAPSMDDNVFVFHDVPAGQYHVTADSDDYAGRKSVEVKAGKFTTVDIALVPR